MSEHPELPQTPPQARTIRSFVRRTGRTTAGQAKAFADVGPQFLANYA
ncbi:MAG: tRNA (guanosine(46)-N7)-methyltransferase TrmB, partial [Pseudomonadota bacterium]